MEVSFWWGQTDSKHECELQTARKRHYNQQ